MQVTAESFTLGGSVFDAFPVSISALKAALGEPVYFKKEYNHIYTWQTLGLCALSKEGALVETIGFYFINEAYDYTPQYTYQQPIIIDHLEMSVFYQQQQAQLNKYGSMNFGRFNLYFEVDDQARCTFFSIEAQQSEETIKKQPLPQYQPRSVHGPKLHFTDFNFKLAVLQVLMYNQDVFEMQFDLYQFVGQYTARDIDIEAEGYDFIPEVTAFFEAFEIEAHWADRITEIHQDGGDDIYGHLLRFWDGEDDTFNIRSFEDAKQFKHLKHITTFYYDDPSPLKALATLGIQHDYL